MAKAKETFGERLTRLMSEAGITQSELARRSGKRLSQTMISDLMLSKKQPGLPKILALMEVLGVDCHALIGDLKPEPPAESA